MFRFCDPGPVFQEDKSRLSEYLPDLVCLSRVLMEMGMTVEEFKILMKIFSFGFFKGILADVILSLFIRSWLAWRLNAGDPRWECLSIFS